MESNQDNMNPTYSRMDSILACLPEGSDIRVLITSLQECVDASLDVPVHCLIASSTSSNIVRKFSLYFDLKTKQRLSLFEESQTQKLLDTLTEFATHQCIVSDKSFAIEHYKKMNPEQSKITEKDIAAFQVPYIHQRVNNPFYLTSDQFSLIQESLVGKDKQGAKEGSALRVVIKGVLQLEELMQSTAVSDKIETTLVQCDDSTMDQIKSFFHLLLSHIHIFAQTSSPTATQAETMVNVITKVIDDVKQVVGVSLDDTSSSQHMIQVNHLLDSLRATYETDSNESDETSAPDISIVPTPVLTGVTAPVDDISTAGDIEIVSMEDISLDDDEEKEGEDIDDSKNEDTEDSSQEEDSEKPGDEEGSSFFSFLSSDASSEKMADESQTKEESNAPVNDSSEIVEEEIVEDNVVDEENTETPLFGESSSSKAIIMDDKNDEDISIQFIDTQNPVSLSKDDASLSKSLRSPDDASSFSGEDSNMIQSIPSSSTPILPLAPQASSSSSFDSGLTPSESSHPLLQKAYGGNPSKTNRIKKSIRRSRQPKASRARSLRRKRRFM